ncbi:hypothetical protein AZE99_03510 [Sphingorhabdus sp. M41]|nr:hypothetical protein AZE99_03510 [Sphingorhabdus sp. M41]
MDKQRSRLSRGRKPNLSNAIFLYCLNEFWNNFAPDQATMSFENTAYAPGSPGRVFLLEEDDIVDRLEQLEEISGGALVWSETAGLRQIIRSKKRSIKAEQRILRETLISDCIRMAA